uniref:Gem (nuclear organelle) associated protein 6 n=1 Tax=Myripristis murdjan TaxID=586833 RepID=A0A667WWF4_9TELE
MDTWPLLGPLDWQHYVNKEVKVKAREQQQQHRGWLLTVDPVSASVVLLSFGEAGGASVRVVMGHADERTAELLRSAFLPRRSRSFGPEELRRRRESARRWLERNRVPVQEDGEALRVAGVLTVEPPYGPEDCSGSNEIILSRVQRLLQGNPEDDA